HLHHNLFPSIHSCWLTLWKRHVNITEAAKITQSIAKRAKVLCVAGVENSCTTGPVDLVPHESLYFLFGKPKMQYSCGKNELIRGAISPSLSTGVVKNAQALQSFAELPPF